MSRLRLTPLGLAKLNTCAVASLLLRALSGKVEISPTPSSSKNFVITQGHSTSISVIHQEARNSLQDAVKTR